MSAGHRQRFRKREREALTVPAAIPTCPRCGNELGIVTGNVVSIVCDDCNISASGETLDEAIARCSDRALFGNAGAFAKLVHALEVQYRASIPLDVWRAGGPPITE